MHSILSQAAQMVKNLPVIQEMLRDTGSIPESGRSPVGGHSNPLQYSCLENPMDRGAWQATDHGVTERQTRLKQLSMHNGTFQEMGSVELWLSFKR